MSQVATVMTKREEPGPSKNLMAETREGEPNIRIISLPWWAMIGIRVLRVYVQGVIGFLGTGFVGLTDGTTMWNTFLHALLLAIPPAVVSLFMNSAEIMAKVDTNNPVVRA